MSNKVWYASYGSNLNRQRFTCYISGGTPPGATHRNPGCIDKTQPSDSRPILLDFDLYFAWFSKSWGGAPAFIRPGTLSVTYGRMYLISDDQFNDIVRQENGMEVNGKRFVPPFDELRKTESFVLPGDRLYGLLLNVDTVDGWPVITFTTPSSDLKIGAPSKAYTKVIVTGLKETYPAMTSKEICRYLLRAEGVRERIPAHELLRWVQEV